jgi:hypothetical protein
MAAAICRNSGHVLLKDAKQATATAYAHEERDRMTITRSLWPTSVFKSILLMALTAGGVAADDQPTAAARRVADEIRREALLPPKGPQGRPLPLASHWNVGTVRGTFAPDHQIGLLQQGHHVLPWMDWPSGDPQMRWAKHGPLEEVSKRYLDLYGRGRSDDFKRKVVGQGWIERYRVMLDAMRDALDSDTWKQNVRFAAYGGFGPSHFGRWEEWKVYSLICDEWTAPDWYFWQGGSPSYYTHNWNENRDHWVFSTQVESMNWVFMLEEAWRVNPDFWFEISTWDGNEIQAWMKGAGVQQPEDLARVGRLSPEERKEVDDGTRKKSKAVQYLIDGQDYPPERAAGWVQFGMWLMRPRVVREFRGHATPLAPVEPYWMETVKAVDRVYSSPVLTDFWRHGDLVANTAHPHPYQVDIPPKYREIPRWYLLDTNLDPPRPWQMETTLPVFSLALVRGEKGSRRWLIYAHSPLESHTGVLVTIPEHRAVTIDVPRAGAFYLIEESSSNVTRISG